MKHLFSVLTLTLSLSIVLTARPGHAQVSIPGEIILKMTDTGDLSAALALIPTFDLQESWPDLNLHLLAIPGNPLVDLTPYLTALEASFNVEYAEPNYLFSKPDNETSGTTYTDDSVQPLVNVGTQSQTSAPIGSTETWAALTEGLTPQVVAVIDTGLNMEHPVFKDSRALWFNPGEIGGEVGVDDDGNGYIDDFNGWNFVNNSNNPDDDDGHGTHVSGIILGVGQDIFAKPIAQAKIRIMVLKFLGPNGGSTSDGIRAIRYAVDNGAMVLNNSWGGPSYSKALNDVIGYAHNNKRLVLAAAGNSGINIDDSPTYPASYTIGSLLTVAATTNSDLLASFSNFGTGHVGIAGPGVSILSTYPPSKFSRLSGTSMATPFVAGTAILMKYESASMSGFQIKQILQDTSKNISELSGFVVTENRLRVLQAIETAQGATVTEEQPGFTPAPGGGGGGGGCGSIAAMGNSIGKSRGKNQRGMPWALLLLPLFTLIWLRYFHSSLAPTTPRA